MYEHGLAYFCAYCNHNTLADICQENHNQIIGLDYPAGPMSTIPILQTPGLIRH